MFGFAERGGVDCDSLMRICFDFRLGSTVYIIKYSSSIRYTHIKLIKHKYHPQIPQTLKPVILLSYFTTHC